MKSVFILLLTIAYSHCIQVSYNSGTIIRPTGKSINAGHTKIEIIMKVPTIQNITLQRFKQPCNYTNDLIADLDYYNITNPTYTQVMFDFSGVCRRNSRLRKSSLALRRSYQQHIIHMEEAMTHFT